MSDLLLDATGDLDLSTNDLQIVDGIQAIRQELQIRYRFFLGEWFLHPEEGTPYQLHVLKKNPNEAKVRQVFADVALTTPGVEEIRALTTSIDNATRTLTVNLELGVTVNGTLVYDSFVIEVEV